MYTTGNCDHVLHAGTRGLLVAYATGSERGPVARSPARDA
jgi:hypothetical protein